MDEPSSVDTPLAFVPIVRPPNPVPNHVRSAVIVGGGLIGMATAYKLLLARPDSRVTVLEKEPTLARHQSGNNSGVLHAGLYYAPGSFKARLAVDGIRQMREFCVRHGVAHEVCGKLVVAVDESELPRLRTLHERGTANGLRDLAWLDADRMRGVEPHVGGVAAVRVPEEGIADFPAVCAAMAAEVERLGGTVTLGARVMSLRRSGAGEMAGWIAESTHGSVEADLLVNCAGLHSDRVARLAGERPDVRIVPFRGEYYTLRPERQGLVRHLIYPVPDPAFPFLGVHFTRMIRGGVECGPNAVLAFSREGYHRRDLLVRDLAEALAWPGLWRFLARYPGTSWREIRRSFSRELFALALRRLVPELRSDDLSPGGAGVRAQAMLASGELVQDFAFLERPAAVHVLNAPSPGATASLAIGDEIVRRATRAASLAP